MTPPKLQHLPVSWEECQQRGWKSLDILLVTGDAYVDHPSFGVALIGRLLEDHGFRVAILPQPYYNSTKDFLTFPEPLLFCGITGGNLDSIVANYSGNGKVRDTDAFSPKGSPWRSSEHNKNNRFRPDRATLVYSNLAKSAYKNTPIVLGGLEASLRRFVHYDYQQKKIRSSFLTDAKADLLVYGMGERAILEIAKRCQQKKILSGINGTCERLTAAQFAERFPQFNQRSSERQVLEIPSLSAILSENKLFMEAELAIDKHSRSESRNIIIQHQQTHWVLQHPAPKLLSEAELDELYELKYTRKPHPLYPNVPAHTMIKDSITIVRGCSGNCSFCAITRHQGAAVQSRSVKSIVKECKTLASLETFKGTISDLGGPTANLYGTSCAIGSCKKRDCLYPQVCKHLRIDEAKFLQLLEEVVKIDNIRHVFISSGLRMELLMQAPKLLRKIIAHHTPGTLKIAPEHSSDDVLHLMHKEPHRLLQDFLLYCKKLSRSIGKDIRLVPYVISSHPGSTVRHASNLAEDMAKLHLTISKFQDFTPTPGTISTAMYVSGIDRVGKPIFVPKNAQERASQRKIIEDKFIGVKSNKKFHKKKTHKR